MAVLTKVLRTCDRCGIDMGDPGTTVAPRDPVVKLFQTVNGVETKTAEFVDLCQTCTNVVVRATTAIVGGTVEAPAAAEGAAPPIQRKRVGRPPKAVAPSAPLSDSAVAPAATATVAVAAPSAPVVTAAPAVVPPAESAPVAVAPAIPAAPVAAPSTENDPF